MQPLSPSPCQCSVLRVFEALASRIGGKSQQTLSHRGSNQGSLAPENLSEQRREPTNSTHINMTPSLEIEPGRRVLSPLRHHCSPKVFYNVVNPSSMPIFSLFQPPIQILMYCLQCINNHSIMYTLLHLHKHSCIHCFISINTLVHTSNLVICQSCHSFCP